MYICTHGKLKTWGNNAKQGEIMQRKGVITQI